MAYNILILALSTIGMNKEQKILSTTYECDSVKIKKNNSLANVLLPQDFSMNGYYQLEPVAKLLHYILKKQNQKLDMIVTLNTKETGEKKEFTIEKSEPSRQYNQSAEEFFVERLKNDDQKIPEEHFPEIRPVREDQLYTSIAKIVQCIRERKAEHKDIRLWIDQHGGFRESMLVLEGVVYLLNHEGIVPEATYTVEHNPQREKKSVIKVVSDHSNVFEFVSGMNEFSHYGRSSALETMLAKDMSTDGRVRKTLGLLMNRISDALQICDMNAFEDSLQAMGECLEKYNCRHESLLDIFIDNIRQEYGDLLNPRKRTVLAEIEWCLNKDYLQQALTLIESRMPEELYVKRVINPKYDTNLEIKRKGQNGWETVRYASYQIRFREAIEKAKNLSNKSWESDINFIFVRWASNNSTRTRTSNENTEKPEIMRLNWNRDEYKTFPVGLDGDRNRSRKLRGEMHAYMNYKNEGDDRNLYSVSYGIMIHRKLKAGEANQLLFNRFLQLHRALKEQRNNANHASSGERYSAQNIRDAIGGYIDLAKEIYAICR